MEHSLYELYSKRTSYKSLRENVINAINILSRRSLDDKLSTVSYSLSNSYLVNEAIPKGAIIKNIKEDLSSDINNLNICLSSINSKIYSLNKLIEEKEAEEGAL